MPECDYCDGEELVYELQESSRGTVHRCIECLAIEQGQQQLKLPLDAYDDIEDDLLQHSYTKAGDWFRILARLKDDDPIIKRDPDAIGTVNEGTREFLTNIMGSAAHYPSSDIIEADGDPAQSTLGEA